MKLTPFLLFKLTVSVILYGLGPYMVFFGLLLLPGTSDAPTLKLAFGYIAIGAVLCIAVYGLLKNILPKLSR
jgi:hypothetical protein